MPVSYVDPIQNKTYNDPPPYSLWREDGTKIYNPFEKQVELFECESPYILYGGARSPGKSYSVLWLSILTCIMIPGCECVIVRKTYDQLHSSIINKFISDVPLEVYSPSGNEHAFNKSTLTVRFDNGSILNFRSCANADVARNLFRGPSYVLICLDEACEFLFSEWEEVKGACRCPIKVDINGDPVHCRIVLATNPGGPGHAWIKSLFVDNKQIQGQDPDSYDRQDYKYIFANILDNPLFANDEDYIKSLGSLSPAKKAAYLEGDWDIMSGQYYDNFSPDATVIDHDTVLIEMDKQPWQPKWISIDWGFVHHSVILWHTNLSILDKATGITSTHSVTYRELALREVGEAALAQEIVRLTHKEKIDRVYLSPDCFGDNENSRAKQIGDILILERNFKSIDKSKDIVLPGLPRPIPATNDRVDGWRFIYELLAHEPDHRSKHLIDSNCSELIGAIPIAIRDSPKKPEDIKKVDQIEDDFLDCFRYGLMSHLRPKVKPEEIEYQEQLNAITDLTQKNIFRLMHDAKKKKKKGFILPHQRR